MAIIKQFNVSEIVDYLLQRGANPTLKNKEGRYLEYISLSSSCSPSLILPLFSFCLFPFLSYSLCLLRYHKLPGGGQSVSVSSSLRLFPSLLFSLFLSLSYSICLLHKTINTIWLTTLKGTTALGFLRYHKLHSLDEASLEQRDLLDKCIRYTPPDGTSNT